MEGKNNEQIEPLSFCFNCGAKMRQMFKFCPNCGQKALARVAVEPPSKVTPISPAARKAIDEFESRLAELRIKKAKKKSPPLIQKDPNITLLVIGGLFLIALIYLIFHLMANHYSAMIPRR